MPNKPKILKKFPKFFTKKMPPKKYNNELKRPFSKWKFNRKSGTEYIYRTHINFKMNQFKEFEKRISKIENVKGSLEDRIRERMKNDDNYSRKK